MGKLSVKIWIVLVAAIGCGLSVLLFQIQQNNTFQHNKAIVTKTSDHYHSILNSRLNSLFREMEIAQHLYQNSDSVDAKTFQIIAHTMVKKANGIVALEWIPRVAHKKLKQHQQSAISNGLPNYYVKEKSISGEFVAVHERPYYYPVFLSEPSDKYIAIQGYDMGSNPDRLSALLKAMNKNITVATVPLTLLQNNLAYDGFLVFKPVYLTSTSTDTIESRSKNLKGFIVGVFSTKALIESAFNFLKEPSKTIFLSDITEPISYTTAHNFSNEKNSNYVQSSTLSIADHKWKLTIKLPDSEIQDTTLFPALIVLVIGISITLLFIFFIYIINTKLRLTTKKNVELTFQNQKNDQLQRILLNRVTNAIISLNHKGIIVSINPAGEKIFGYQSKELIGENISILIPAPHDHKHEQYLDQYLRTGKSKAVGHRRRVQALHRLGHKITLELDITEVNSRDTPHFSLVAQDVSTQIESEKLTKRLLEITRLSPDFIASFDAAGTIIFANDPARKALGCTAKEDIKNHRLDSIFPSDANDFFQKSKRHPDYLHSWIGESVFVTAQGQATSVSQLLLSHPCNANETQYYTVFMRDITKDKKSQIEILRAKQIAEKIVNSQSERFKNMLDDISIPAGVIKTCIKNLYTGCIGKYVNDVFFLLSFKFNCAIFKTLDTRQTKFFKG